MPEPLPLPRPPLQGRILVVDDLETNREAMTRLLLREGLAVESADDGQEALEKLEAGAFDVVLLDVMMPRLDGLQTLEALRSREATAELPVIMLSALQESRSVRECLEHGADDYLFKPLDRALLRVRIAACLRRKQLADQAREQRARLEALEAEVAQSQRRELRRGAALATLKEALEALELPEPGTPAQQEARRRLEEALDVP